MSWFWRTRRTIFGRTQQVLRIFAIVCDSQSGKKACSGHLVHAAVNLDEFVCAGKGHAGNRLLGRVYDTLVRKAWKECAARGMHDVRCASPFSHVSVRVSSGDEGFSVDVASLTLDAEQETQAMFESRTSGPVKFQLLV